MPLLAIETSCDETCAAIMAGGRLLANVIASQEIHQQYGGVVPELASRAHLRHISGVVRTALARAQVQSKDLQALAVTYGPGLIGSLLVGVSFAKGMALDLKLPLLGINHLEGHLFSNNVDPGGPQPPFLVLIISGGHSILALVKAWGDYEILGETQDDAAGEAFDKVARLLGLPYPGGPQIEKLAQSGRAEAISFPIARLKGAPFDFSFSGLKTAVLYHLRDHGALSGSGGQSVVESPELARLKADVAASFQKALIAAMVETTARAHERWPVAAVAMAGGVACNEPLRAALGELGKQRAFKLFYPRPIYCTDNAAMIAAAAEFYFKRDRGSKRLFSEEDLRISPQPSLRLA
ncbi:MAG: tRNA (adenosine(37)-N6)-threonylcarbamoyltransferase complex transferase subunit TsaD [bacterium]